MSKKAVCFFLVLSFLFGFATRALWDMSKGFDIQALVDGKENASITGVCFEFTVKGSPEFKYTPILPLPENTIGVIVRTQCSEGF